MATISLYWRSVRPFAFTVSVVPPILGSLVAALHIPGLAFNWFHFVLVLLGCMIAHAGSNTLSDYRDYKKQVDRQGTYGSSGVLVEKLMTPAELLRWAFILYLAAALIAAYLVWRAPNGLNLLWLIGLGWILAFFYTIGPLNLKYVALGDPAVFIAFGPAMTLGAYMVQTGQFSWYPVLYAIPVALLVDAVLHSNNLRDIQNDQVAHITTVPILFGESFAKGMYYVLVYGAYVLIPVLILTAKLPWLALLTLISLPMAIRAAGMVKTKSAIPEKQFAMIDAITAQLHSAFSVLLITGLLIQHFIN
jgi:1,4-dihydroxy-2-naphthoate polyprenyltransferase